MTLAADIGASIDRVRACLGERTPRIAVLLGSGWGGMTDVLRDAVQLSYTELPAFPTLGVSGHAGQLHAGRIGTTEVMVLAGRQHAYETGDVAAMKGAIRTLAGLGVHTLVQTNAAGSLDPNMPPGSLMLLSDHLNLVQHSPLWGDTGNTRFVGMADAYDPALRRVAQRVALHMAQALHEGVYAWVMGPQFETPAEIRMLAVLGAQAVGMSTVPETVLARHAGLRVLAVSLITNLAAGLSDQPLSHEHTLAMARKGAASAMTFLQVLVPALAAERPQNR